MMYWVGLGIVMLIAYGLIILEEKVNDQTGKR
jgi:multidrug transporter EmrE-like cation transporter